jgi:hypothetical protein
MLDIHKRKNKINSGACLCIFLLVPLMSFWFPAQAQAQNRPSSEPNSAHIKNRDKVTPQFIVEHEIPIKTEIPAIQFASCQAFLSLESHQRDTLARVVTTIEQESCPTSTGEYVLLVSIKDENGDSHNLSFSEKWDQKDNAPIEISRDYPIGENVTLKRIIAQRVRCECTDS